MFWIVTSAIETGSISEDLEDFYRFERGFAVDGFFSIFASHRELLTRLVSFGNKLFIRDEFAGAHFGRRRPTRPLCLALDGCVAVPGKPFTTYADAIALANETKGADPYGYRAEAIQLMRLAESLSAN